MVAIDPETSRKVAAASRSVWMWYHQMKDLSGLSLAREEHGWFAADRLPPTLLALFGELGRLYAPFMAANAAAVAAGRRVLACRLDSGAVPWEQNAFKYQAKCLGWLRALHAALGDADRDTVRPVLAQHPDLARLFAPAPAHL